MKPLQTPRTIRLGYELTLCELEREQEPWSKLHTRVLRSCGLDSGLNNHFELVNNRMDFLLDDLFIKMGQLGINNGQPRSV